jgi:sarcosine oxidase subunit delta
MSFLLPCPNCGPRDVNEFAYQGEVTARPRGPSPAFRELTSYLYFRRNVAGLQREWWYHRNGCEQWFIAERDTRTNEVLDTTLPPSASDSRSRRLATPAPAEAPVPDTPAV